MNRNIIVASAAALLIALGSAAAGARNMGGGHFGGGHFGGGHFGGGHIGGGHMGGMGHFNGHAFNGHIGHRSAPNFGNFKSRGPSFAHNGNWDRGRHRGHGRRYFFAGGLPYYGGYYDYGYAGGDCGWLYDQAVRTGSSYWWYRYETCES